MVRFQFRPSLFSVFIKYEKDLVLIHNELSNEEDINITF
jgi:hypothetical protein